MEFMNAENACLVPYTLVPVAAGAYPHHKDQLWAEPDIEAAASWMLRLVLDSDLRAAIARSNYGLDSLAKGKGNGGQVTLSSLAIPLGLIVSNII